MTKPTFQAFCLVCYTCELTRPVSKRKAERAATGHLKAYGHKVTILPVTIPAKTEAR